MAKILSDSILVSKPNAPMDARTEVDLLADVMNIENPSGSLIFKVKETGEYYKVVSLKEVMIEGTTHRKKVINAFEPLSIKDAPKDGYKYVRMNGDWVRIDSSNEDSEPDKPIVPEIPELPEGGFIRINITSDCKPLDNYLKGAIISIRNNSTGTLEKEIVWDGKMIVYDAVDGADYTISVSDMDGYTTPVEQQFIVLYESNDITFTYECDYLLIDINSDTEDFDEGINVATIKVTDKDTGDINYHGTWQGEKILAKVIREHNYIVSVGEVEDYKNHDDVECSASIGKNDLTITYAYKNVIEINLTSNTPDWDYELKGALVSIVNDTIGELTYYDVWNGEPLRFKAKLGNRYDVVAGEVANYSSPETISFIAVYGLNHYDMVYDNNTAIIDTVLIDESTLVPGDRLSGDLRGPAVMSIYDNAIPIAAKYTSEGVVTYCPLSKEDMTLFHDGTSSVAETTERFVKFPTFYYKFYKEGTNVVVKFAYGKYTGKKDEWYEWDTNLLVSSIGAIDWGGTHVIAGGGCNNQMVVGITYGELEQKIKARKGFDAIPYYVYKVLAFLVMCYNRTFEVTSSNFPDGVHILEKIDGSWDSKHYSFGLKYFACWDQRGRTSMVSGFESVNDEESGELIYEILDPKGNIVRINTNELASDYYSKMYDSGNNVEFLKPITDTDGATSETGYKAYANSKISVGNAVMIGGSITSIFNASTYASKVVEIDSKQIHRLIFRGDVVEELDTTAFNQLTIYRP